MGHPETKKEKEKKRTRFKIKERKNKENPIMVFRTEKTVTTDIIINDDIQKICYTLK